MFVLNSEAIRQAIKKRGFSSVRQLAQTIGMHRNSLSRFISGKEAVLPESVSRLIDLLVIEIDKAIIRDPTSPSLQTEEIAALIDALLKSDSGVAYVLFGSRARNKAKRYSDFDIGIYAADGIDLKRYMRLIDVKEIEEENLPVFVDLVNLNNADSEFLHNIAPDLQFLAGRHSDWISLRKRCAI